VNPWLVAFLTGLGAMKTTQMLKEATPWPLQPWTKSFVSMVLAIGGCALAGIRGADLLWFGIGTAGWSALAHEVRDVLSVAGDNLKVNVLTRTAGTGRRRL
jgi:hypothetical protein